MAPMALIDKDVPLGLTLLQHKLWLSIIQREFLEINGFRPFTLFFFLTGDLNIKSSQNSDIQLQNTNDNLPKCDMLNSMKFTLFPLGGKALNNKRSKIDYIMGSISLKHYVKQKSIMNTKVHSEHSLELIALNFNSEIKKNLIYKETSKSKTVTYFKDWAIQRAIDNLDEFFQQSRQL